LLIYTLLSLHFKILVIDATYKTTQSSITTNTSFVFQLQKKHHFRHSCCVITQLNTPKKYHERMPK